MEQQQHLMLDSIGYVGVFNMPKKFDRFFIAPLDLGQQTNLKPWLIPDKAFELLRNVYIWRGRLKKRFGSIWMGNNGQLSSRVRINLGVIPGGGTLVGTVPGVIWKIGQIFSVDTDVLTVITAGPAALITTGTTTGTFNTANGAFTITGMVGSSVYFYPSEPIMGIMQYESSAINDEPTFAFDTQFAYQFIAGFWERRGTSTLAPNPGIWTGSNADFFWGTTWRGLSAADRILFVTNYVTADLIQYWDGTVWTQFSPFLNVAMTQQLFTARILVPFKNRLVALNTRETNGTFVNRCRFSQNGDPTDPNVSWLEDTKRGGFIDAPTREQIISAEFLKDRLIVFFERSTWELVYTGNYILPFTWQQINTELGAESTFSIVPFDKVILGVGETGINACNGANVERIDELIPDEVWSIHNGNDGVFRVHGIRDYFTEQVYWTFPPEEGNPVYPRRVLIYDYRQATWAFNDDSITAFGYFQPSDDRLWQNMTQQWQEEQTQWNLGTLQSQFRTIVAGNQQGYIFLIKPEISRNAPVLQITNITIASPAVFVVVDHNLISGDNILIENVMGTGTITNLNNKIYEVDTVVGNNITLLEWDIPNQTFNSVVNTGTYNGNGNMTRISPIVIDTKQYNFYQQEGLNAFVQKVDYLVSRTAHGQIVSDYQVNSSGQSMVTLATVTQTILGNNILETTPITGTTEGSQDRLWHTVYYFADGNVIQFNFYFNNDQIFTPNIALSDLEIHGFIIYASPNGRLQ